MAKEKLIIPDSCDECQAKRSCPKSTRFLTQNCFNHIQEHMNENFIPHIAGENEQPGELID